MGGRRPPSPRLRRGKPNSHPPVPRRKNRFPERREMLRRIKNRKSLILGVGVGFFLGGLALSQFLPTSGPLVVGFGLVVFVIGLAL